MLSWLSLLNWIGALTLSLLLKLPWRKLGPWFVLWSFCLLRLLSISIDLPYNTVVMSGLLLLVATWNCWISYKNRYAGLLVLHLLSLLNPHCWNLARLSLFCRYYLWKMFIWIGSTHSIFTSTRYSDSLHDFSVTIARCYKDVFVNSFFPDTYRLLISLPIECFPWTSDLNGLKSGIDRHLLTVCSL